VALGAEHLTSRQLCSSQPSHCVDWGIAAPNRHLFLSCLCIEISQSQIGAIWRRKIFDSLHRSHVFATCCLKHACLLLVRLYLRGKREGRVWRTRPSVRPPICDLLLVTKLSDFLTFRSYSSFQKLRSKGAFRGEFLRYRCALPRIANALQPVKVKGKGIKYILE